MSLRSRMCESRESVRTFRGNWRFVSNDSAESAREKKERREERTRVAPRDTSFDAETRSSDESPITDYTDYTDPRLKLDPLTETSIDPRYLRTQVFTVKAETRVPRRARACSASKVRKLHATRHDSRFEEKDSSEIVVGIVGK